MLLHPLIEQLRALRLTGMADMLTEQLHDTASHNLSFEERLAFLVDRESSQRKNRLLKSRLRLAKLHCPQACIEDINYAENRHLDKKLIAVLSLSSWLHESKNVIITGATGTGKSWLACAIGHKACLLGFKVQYVRMSRLLEELGLARADGRYLNILKSFEKMDLLIFDDWGMETLVGYHQQQVLQIIDDRYMKKSTLVTSQFPISSWHDRIEDKTYADAILDRMTSHTYRIELQGDSMRQKLAIKKKEVNDNQ